MEDAENAIPSSKKRAAVKQLSRDNPGLDDEEDASQQEAGTFKRASDEVMATRRIVKVRRNATASAPSSNPFAGIRLVPPTESSPNLPETTSDTQTVAEQAALDNVDGKDSTINGSDEVVEDTNKPEGKINGAESEAGAGKENVEAESTPSEAAKLETATEVNSEPAAEGDKTENEEPAGDDKTKDEGNTEDEDKKEEAAEKDKQEDMSKNEEEEAEKDKREDNSKNVEPGKENTPWSTFQQLSSSQNAFTGLAGTGFSSSAFSFGSITKDGPATTFGLSNNGSSSIFSNSGASVVSKCEGSGFPSMKEVPVETGEENEKVVFNADSVLFEFTDGVWKERGKGELKVNVSTDGAEKARLLMRARGNFRLILNASLYPDMKLTNMDRRGVTFACVNSNGEGKDGLSTFALKFKDGSIVEEFRAAVLAHKGKNSSVLKTPENSPKAGDD